MNHRTECLPIGCQGPVRTWASLLPTAARALQLPRDRAQLRQAAAEPFDVIEVTAVTESLGRIEDALLDLAGRLTPGGTLLLDVDSQQSLRLLRLVIEGRPGCFDPAGSTDDPSQFLSLRRVLAATAAAQLLVRDVIAVPPTAPELDASFAQSLAAHGLLPLDWRAGPPPQRFWLVCQKLPTLAGSVLLAGGDALARARTEACLRRFLPDDWEVVVGDGVRESSQWNRALAAARGELVWFLRGGAEPTQELFAALSVPAAVGPVAPGHGEQRALPGDLCGTMMPRLEALFAGPLDEHLHNSRIAGEEQLMRIDGKLQPTRIVPVALRAPEAPTEAPAVLAEEAKALFASWSLVEAVGVPGARGGSGAAPTPTPARPVAPWAGRRPRVSLCMIARDEERFLGECLARAQAAVDEIVLVDTGSTDRTVAIAESFGAKVLHEPWQDDFSAPRNTALRAATGDWILVLDADEFLQPGAAERIRELVTSEVASGYHLHFVNVYGSGRTLGVMMVRLFRNLPGIAYENVIHEQVTPSLQRLALPLGLVLLSADVEVEHHGYRDEVMTSRGKNERNERLFHKQLAAQPDDVYAHYKYGDFLRRVPGRSADARRLLDRCLELILQGPPSLPRELPYAGEVAALCALEAARAGDHTRARAVLDGALRRFLPTPNLHYLAASLALTEQRSHDAILHYRRCLAYHGQVLVVPIQDGITSHVSLAGIAQAWLQLGDLQRAHHMLERAIAIEPSYEVAQLALSKLWLQRGDLGRALGVLTKFLSAHPDSPGACQQTTLLLHRLGHLAQAKRMGQQAVSLLEARALDTEAAAMREFLAGCDRQSSPETRS
ncbi:MAG: glycosyltransferase [Planctomycetes bacterium]|nr:glycosyltransferase [Planctomycetota bacterium]